MIRVALMANGETSRATVEKNFMSDRRKAKVVFAGVSGITTSLSLYSFWILTLGVKRGVKQETANANARMCH